MPSLRRSLLAALFAVIAVSAVAQSDGARGYLADGGFDVTPILPPAPQAGDPRYEADRAIFKATRKLVGTPRYLLATSDAQTDAPSLMQDFSCAVGVGLTAQDAPRTLALIQRAARDTAAQTNHAKDVFKRLRPFLIDPGEICQDKVMLARSFDYPSGHTTAGWTWAMILAGLVPERAGAILARGRAYGESRIVCGAHNASAVEAGRLSATATLTAMQGLAAYRQDETAARQEMAALLSDPRAPRPQQCQDEAALIAQKLP